jgi:hypothetical protein
MSKSRSNVTVSEEILGQYGADSLRQWAAGGAEIPFKSNRKEGLPLPILLRTSACLFQSTGLKPFTTPIGGGCMGKMKVWFVLPILFFLENSFG